MAATKLLLIEDVRDLGRSGDIVTVRPGYARNKLLPCGAAVLADRKALRMQERLKEERLKKAQADKEEADKLKASIDGIVVKTIVKVAHDGHMYGSVSIADIVHLLQEKAKVTIEKRTVQLKHAIKETGVFEIQLKLNEGVIASFHLKVVPEGAESDETPEATEAPESKEAE